MQDRAIPPDMSVGVMVSIGIEQLLFSWVNQMVAGNYLPERSNLDTNTAILKIEDLGFWWWKCPSTWL